MVQKFFTETIISGKLHILHMMSLDLYRMLQNILNNYKQLLDEVFVISRIIKVEVKGYQPKPKAEADNPYRDCFIIH